MTPDTCDANQGSVFPTVGASVCDSNGQPMALPKIPEEFTRVLITRNMQARDLALAHYIQILQIDQDGPESKYQDLSQDDIPLLMCIPGEPGDATLFPHDNHGPYYITIPQQREARGSYVLIGTLLYRRTLHHDKEVLRLCVPEKLIYRVLDYFLMDSMYGEISAGKSEAIPTNRESKDIPQFSSILGERLQSMYWWKGLLFDCDEWCNHNRWRSACPDPTSGFRLVESNLTDYSPGQYIDSETSGQTAYPNGYPILVQLAEKDPVTIIIPLPAPKRYPPGLCIEGVIGAISILSLEFAVQIALYLFRKKPTHPLPNIYQKDSGVEGRPLIIKISAERRVKEFYAANICPRRIHAKSHEVALAQDILTEVASSFGQEEATAKLLLHLQLGLQHPLVLAEENQTRIAATNIIRLAGKYLQAKGVLTVVNPESGSDTVPPQAHSSTLNSRDNHPENCVASAIKPQQPTLEEINAMINITATISEISTVRLQLTELENWRMALEGTQYPNKKSCGETSGAGVELAPVYNLQVKREFKGLGLQVRKLEERMKALEKMQYPNIKPTANDEPGSSASDYQPSKLSTGVKGGKGSGSQPGPNDKEQLRSDVQLMCNDKQRETKLLSLE